MKAIIAFEIEVTRLDHSFKLSQNRTEKDYHNIIEHLRAGDAASRQMADTMFARKEIVFNANHTTEPGI